MNFSFMTSVIFNTSSTDSKTEPIFSANSHKFYIEDFFAIISTCSPPFSLNGFSSKWENECSAVLDYCH